jgi:hypothetical protein
MRTLDTAAELAAFVEAHQAQVVTVADPDPEPEAEAEP